MSWVFLRSDRGEPAPRLSSSGICWPASDKTGKCSGIIEEVVISDTSTRPATDLFDRSDGYRPLADRMRPATLAEFVGQAHLLSPGKPLHLAIEQGRLHSMVFWGPPGTGKTTLARIISSSSHAQFLSLSAVLAGVKEIRRVIEQARLHGQEKASSTVLFIDEVHRFNKVQQDAFLPYIEDGTFYFIGATTENPSFELNNALLSRARTYVLKRLTETEVGRCIDAALLDEERGLGSRQIRIDPQARELLAVAADGDARRALNFLEIASDWIDENEMEKVISCEIVKEVTAQGTRRFDKQGEYFYDQISALHKSVRGSDPDASLYWFCRMVDGGCDPHYIARRVLRMAVEDIGNADPRGLQIAMSAWQTYERLGSPEGELAIAQAIVYLACMPKSNAVYRAYGLAMKDAKTHGSQEVPMHLRNAPTKLMKDLGHGQGYRYAHDEPDAYVPGECYFPEILRGTRYYEPEARGLELKIREHLDKLRSKTENRN